jgi:hypothetical protein
MLTKTPLGRPKPSKAKLPFRKKKKKKKKKKRRRKEKKRVGFQVISKTALGNLICK